MSDPSPTHEATLSLRSPGSKASSVPPPALEVANTSWLNGESAPPSAAVSSDSPPSLSRYVFKEIIARGGMGVIWRVHDTALNRDLALKVLRPELQHRPDMLSRFLEEAQIGGQLQHPGIVPVHELGHLNAESDGKPAPYFTMKLIQGKTLGDLLAGRCDKKPDRAQLLLLFQQVCQTLAFAHARGVIHRDLKPSNIMVGDFGEVLVMDWGVAKNLHSDKPDAIVSADAIAPLNGRGSSLVGSVVGTPGYMAPEQARGETDQLDERCDVFGLGAILCEILTGEPPYRGYDTTVLTEVQRGNLDSALQRLAACQAEPDLIALAKHCLAAERNARPRHAGEVAEALNRHLSSVAERLRQAELAAERDRARAQQKHKAQRLMLALCATLVLTVLVGGSAWVHHRQTAERRKERITHEVEQHLTEATRLRSEAQKQPPIEVEKWLQALAAAQQARASLASGDGDAELAARVNILLAELQSESDTARTRAEEVKRDQKMLHDLEEAQNRTSDVIDDRFAHLHAEPYYIAAYRDYGVTLLESTTNEAAEGLRGRAIEPQLIEGLYSWLYCANRQHETQLLDVLDLLDKDVWRSQYRKAYRKRNGAELYRLSQTVDIQAEPLTVLIQLSRIISGQDWKGEIEASVQLLERLQKRYPNDFWVNHHLAFALCNSKPSRSQEAVGYYRAAIAIRPQSPGPYLNMANVFNSLGRDDLAREALEKAIELKPDYAMAYINLGHHYLHRGDHPRAIELYQKAIQLRDRDPMFFDALGIAYHHNRDYVPAIEAFQQALTINPNHGRAQTHLAEVYYDQKKYDEAYKAADLAVQMDPNYPPVYRLLANLVTRKGDRTRAYQYSRRAVQLDASDADNWRFLGWSANRLGLTLEAETAWKKCVALNPKDSECQYWLGTLYQGRGMFAQAVPVLDQAARGNPNMAEYHCNLGLALCWSGQFESAISELRIGHELGSKRMNWSYTSAAWLQRAERLAAKDKQLLGVLNGQSKPAPEDVILFAMLAGIRGYHVEATKLFETAFAQQPPLGDQRLLAIYHTAQGSGGRGQLLTPLTEQQTEALRRKCLDWLREELKALTATLKQSPGRSYSVADSTNLFLHDERLASVRGPSLNALPEKEREEWKTFWAEVQQLEKQARQLIAKQESERGS